MTNPIYQLFVGNNNIAANLAWKALSEEERKALREKEEASRKEVGAEFLLFCDSGWADEMHPWWGVHRFPDLQARIAHTRTLQEIGWLDITDAFSLLGTAMMDWTPPAFPNPVYKLWIVKSSPAGALNNRLPKDLDALRWEKHMALYKEHGSQVVIYCASSWCNEIYPAFGISAYPNVEANAKIQAGLDDLGWPGYFESITYLGIAPGA